MKKILCSIFIFGCLIFYTNSFAAKDDVRYSMGQLLSCRNSKLTLSPDQLAFVVKAGVFNFDKFIKEFSPRIIELGNDIISDLEKELTIYNYQKHYFIYLLKRIFDKNFLECLILEQSLNLSKWTIDEVERFGLGWLLQEAFGGCPEYSINFENNFIREKLVPKLIRFCNKFFVVKKVDLLNNNLPELSNVIDEFPSIIYVIV